MSTIAKAFDHGKALIPFITCGDPSMEKTAEYVRAVVDAGADLVELGIPFSDPTAEGDVIMAADARALAAGTTTEKVFDLVRELRRDITVPMVFMTYANVLFSYGSEDFIRTSRDIGIDGFILPDIPYEEKDHHDRKRGLRLFVLCLLPGSHRYQKLDHDRCRSHGTHRQTGQRHPLRSGLRNLRSRTGCRHGCCLGRRYRGIRDHEDHCCGQTGYDRGSLQVCQGA